ncbi:MAG: hypothetical protein ACOC3V_01480 [bacterium]
MNINDLDSELSIKSKEILKKILKKPNVNITFEIPDDENVLELVVIKHSFHNFLLYKEETNRYYTSINDKYLKFFTPKLKSKLNKLDIDDKINLINKKYWFYKILRPFLGKIYFEKEEEFFNYRLNYNSVIFNLSKIEYDRFMYYTSYVYKLHQLTLLNKELNIHQEFKIIFDDDKSISDLYKNINNNLKNIINPIGDDFDDDDDDFDDDDLDDDDFYN